MRPTAQHERNEEEIRRSLFGFGAKRFGRMEFQRDGNAAID